MELESDDVIEAAHVVRKAAAQQAFEVENRAFEAKRQETIAKNKLLKDDDAKAYEIAMSKRNELEKQIGKRTLPKEPEKKVVKLPLFYTTAEAQTLRIPILSQIATLRAKKDSSLEDNGLILVGFMDCHNEGEALVADVALLYNIITEQLSNLHTKKDKYHFLASEAISSQLSALVDRIVKIQYSTLKCTIVKSAAAGNHDNVNVCNLTKKTKPVPLDQLVTVLQAYTRPIHKLINWWFSLLSEYASQCNLTIDVAKIKTTYDQLISLLNQDPNGHVVEGFSHNHNESRFNCEEIVLGIAILGLGWAIYHHHTTN